MNVQIVCHSKKHTKKIAEAMGRAIHVTPQTMNADMTSVEADILFLGCGIYGGNVLPEVMQYIETLNPEKVKRIVLFSTSAKGEDQTQPLREKLISRGFNVDAKTFAGKGSFMFFVNRSQPDKKEESKAAEFAKEICE